MPTEQTMRGIGKFLITGGSVAIFHLLFVYILTSLLGIWYLASTIFSYTCAIMLNFVLQKKFVFTAPSQESGRTEKHRFSLFTTVAVLHLVLNTLLMYSFVDLFGFNYLLAQIAILFFLSLATYFINRYFIFN